MIVKPLHDFVLIEVDEAEEESAGGILLTAKSRERTRTGTVLACGPGSVNTNGGLVPLTVTEEDRVLFDRSAGRVVKIDGEERLMMREGDIFAIIV